MTDCVKVAKVADFVEGNIRTFRFGRHDVAVVSWRGRFYAFRNQCTHSAFSFDYTCLQPTGLLECPTHGAVFNLETGEVLKGPAAADLPIYGVSVEGEDVLLDLGA